MFNPGRFSDGAWSLVISLMFISIKKKLYTYLLGVELMEKISEP